MNDGATKHRYLAGIDGGQSGVRCLIVRDDGQVYGYGRSGKIDFLLAPGGKERTAEVIKEALSEAMGRERGGGDVPIFSAFLGLSGVVSGGAIERAALDVGSHVMGTERVYADNDGVSAWAGALALQPGIIAIAGSGSLVFGIDSRNVRRRAGGWGYVFGDEAGAFGIAVSSIKLALHDVDSGVCDSPLANAVLQHFSEDSLNTIVKKFYAGAISRAQIAGLTPVLARMADEGDVRVRNVFADAARILAGQVAQVASHLDWDGPAVRWSPIGGVFNSGELIIGPMRDELSRISSLQFTLVEPQLPPVAGAALLAYSKSIGSVPPSVISRLKGSFTSIEGA